MTSVRSRNRVRSFSAIVAVIVLAAVGLIVLPTAASAATFAVTSNADSGSGTLRQAILDANAAAGADTITFAPSLPTIVLLSTITVTETLTIDGSATPVTITGQGGLFALLIIAPSTANQDFALNDVVFDGTASTGWTGVALDTGFGALNNTERSLTLTRMTAKNINSGPFQGAGLRDFVMQNTGPITIADSTFSNNTSSTSTGNGGGALYFRGTNGLVTITGSTFTSNSAISGGAIFLDFTVADVAISSSTFTANSATGPASASVTDGRGGAIAGNSVGNLTVTASTFSGNTAFTGDGGAIAIAAFALAADQATITNSTFSGNHAKTGGAFWSATTIGDIAVAGSTFSGNTVSTAPIDNPLGNSIRLSGVGNHGLSISSSTSDEAVVGFDTWAISVESTGTSPLTIAHSTIVGPGAVKIGALTGAASSITHSILSSVGAANDALVVTTPGAGTIAASWNLDSGVSAAYLALGAGNQFSVSDFGLAALANNGGPTMTRLPSDASPAHNSGNPSIVGAPSADQRGLARVVQTIDIGAVELQTLALAATGVTVQPWLPIGAILLVAFGIAAVVFGRRRRRGLHRR